MAEAIPVHQVVPEHEVKHLLARAGVAVPRAIVAGTPGAAAQEAAGLAAPLVVKAFGPAILHKTDLGAVVLDVDHTGVERAAGDMAAGLADRGIAVDGFLVEEQAPAGIEVLVGVVRRPPFGLVVLLGTGGTGAELADDVVARLVPLTAEDASAMVSEWRGSARLDGYRGSPALDRRALEALLVAMAGADGVAVRADRPEHGIEGRSGWRVAELECNPVRVLADGAVALDARLLVEPAPVDVTVGATGRAVPADFEQLFHPRTVAIAGASTSGRPSFGTRALQAYQALGWDEGLFAVHPEATEIQGVPAYPSVVALPSPVDYLLVALPAERCAPLLDQAAGRVAFTHVISGGFAESGPEGAERQRSLAAAARSAGARLLGPNCMGIYSPRGRHAFQLGVPLDAGTVAVVSQSGGLSGDIIKGGHARGLRFSNVVSLGNAADVTPGELVGHFLGDGETDVIGLYLEGASGGPELVPALRRAAGRTPVVALVGGRSGQGAAAAASHTGALAGDGRLWQAVSASTGVTVVDTLEELLGALLFFQAHGPAGRRAPGGAPSVLVVGPGGGASVLATDACERAGLWVATVAVELQAELRGQGFGVGMSVANPAEVSGGPLAPPDVFHGFIGPVLEQQRFDDVLLHLNVQAYYSFGGKGSETLLATLALLGETRWPGGARTTVVLRNLECAGPAEVAAILEAGVAAGLPCYRTFDEATVAIAAGQRFDGAAARLTRPAP